MCHNSLLSLFIEKFSVLQSWPVGILPAGSFVRLMHLIILWALPHILPAQDVPGSSRTFSTPALMWRMADSLLLGWHDFHSLPRRAGKRIHVHTHTYLCLFPYLSVTTMKSRLELRILVHCHTIPPGLVYFFVFNSLLQPGSRYVWYIYLYAYSLCV